MLAHIHDNICDCNQPIVHTAALIFEEEPDLKFSPPELDIIKKCLTGETTAIAATDHEPDVIGEGDLEDLFKEDFGDEKSTG